MSARRRLGWEVAIWGTLIAISLIALLWGLLGWRGGLVPDSNERIISRDVLPRAVITETTSITRTDLLTIEDRITQTAVVTAQVSAANIVLSDASRITSSDTVTAASQRVDSDFVLDAPPGGATVEPGSTATGRLLGLWLPLGGLLVSVLGLVTNVMFELRRDQRERRDLSRLAQRRQLEIDKLQLEIQMLRGDLDPQPFDEEGDEHTDEEPWISLDAGGRSRPGEYL